MELMAVNGKKTCAFRILKTAVYVDTQRLILVDIPPSSLILSVSRFVEGQEGGL